MNNKVVVVVAVVVVGFAVGTLLSGLVRRIFSSGDRPDSLKNIAPDLGALVFWGCVATGIIAAIGVTSPATLEPIPTRLIDFLPKAIVAGLMVIVAKALGGFGAAVVGQALKSATGRPQPAIERAIGGSILVLGVLLAATQLGIDTALLNLIIGAGLAAIAGTFALLAGFGGRKVASNIAAGRSLRNHLVPGGRVMSSVVEGLVIENGPVTVAVQTSSGSVVHVPYDALLDSPMEISMPPGTEEAPS